MALEFIFNPKIQRYKYKDTGKFLSQEAANNLTRKAINQATADINTIADLLVQGKINVTTWEQATAQALKNIHTWNYLLGNGGQKNITAADYGVLGAKLKKEYQYLRKFSQEIITEGMTEAQFRARLQQYIQSTQTTYEKARKQSHKKAGFAWEKRIRTKINSCNPCISYESAGWQPLGSLPDPGDKCECRSNCGCFKQFSSELVKPQDGLISKWGWIAPLSNRLKNLD